MLKRTHNCGELRASHIDSSVVLAGWVDSNRDHGGLVFLDLRDRYGRTQIVFDSEARREIHDRVQKLHPEDVIAVRGVVRHRPEGTVNPDLATGEIEIVAHELELLNSAQTPPFEISDWNESSTEVRLKHRYLDLRRPKMQHSLITRHQISHAMRTFLTDKGFIEIETPFITTSTPEGARDYLVPSRLHHGSFYALPQSPQLFKQLLMVAGFDKYFQMARCFRDEDLRADRQPEFTQLDIEMSFIDEEDMISATEQMLVYVLRAAVNVELTTPLPRISYADAFARYGTDKPDTRYALELVDISDIASRSDFNVFKGTLSKGGVVKGLRVPAASPSFSRKDLDALTSFAQEQGAKGLAWFRVEDGALASPIAKFFSDELQRELISGMGAESGDLLLFIADSRAVADKVCCILREHLAKKLDLIPEGTFNFLWVVDFPMFELNEESGEIEPAHHPFAAPVPEDEPKLAEAPLDVRARAYDLVLNGTEIASGNIRIHKPELQRRIFRALGISEQQAERRFGFLLRALSFGAPPHGGIAFGLDRFVMLLLGFDTIRDVIAFPKTQRALCPLTGAPAPVGDEQLRELGIKLRDQEPS